jgi:hypothetical protein
VGEVLTLPLGASFLLMALPSLLLGLLFLPPPAVFPTGIPDLGEYCGAQRAGNAEKRDDEHRPGWLHAAIVRSRGGPGESWHSRVPRGSAGRSRWRGSDELR